MTLYARLLPDIENPNWHFMSRTDPRNPDYVRALQVPQTVKYFGDTGQISLNARYRKLFESWNTKAAIKYNDRNGGGWHNRGSSVRQLLFATNLVKVSQVVGDRVYFCPYILTSPPTGVMKYKFTVVTPQGETVNPPCGDLWIMAIAHKNRSVYFRMSDVELLDL